MAKFTYQARKLSDLILHEADSAYIGYTRADKAVDATVTLVSGDVLTLGTPVFRAKSAVSGTKWEPVKTSNAISAAYEYALVIANGLGEQYNVTGPGDRVVTLLVRGNVTVKDATLKAACTAIGLTLPDDQADLIHLLKAQGIVAETTIA
jgi:hypothetical protein